MIRLVLVLLFALALGRSVAAAESAAANANAAPAAISAGQARAALDVLNDPAKRAAFAATLNAIVKAQPGAAPAATTEADPTKPAATTIQGLTLPLAPDSLGAQVLMSASAFVNRLGREAVGAMQTVQSLPLLYGWAVVMVTNPVARDLLVDVTWRVAVALACAIAVEYALRRATRRPIRRLESHARTSTPPPDAAAVADRATQAAIGDPATAAEIKDAVARAEADPISRAEADPISRAEAGDTEPPAAIRHKPSAWAFLRRVPLVIARLALELVPVLGIVLVGHLIAASSIGGSAGGSQGAGGETVSQLIILAVIEAYALSAILLSIARMMLSPEAGHLRLFHLNDAAAAYLMRWTRRIVLIAVVGYAVTEAWLLLGLSEAAHDLLQKAVGLVVHVCLAIVVLQKRAAVRNWLRAPAGATGAISRFRNGLAAGWHWTALFLLIAIWLVYAIELPHGFAAVLHYLVVTGALLIGARLTLLVLLGGIDRLTRPDEPALGLSPSVDTRLRVYLPVVSGALRFIIYLLCTLALLQLYGLNTFVWLISSALGLRILSSTATLVATIVLAFGVWEAVNSAIQRHLDKLQRQSQLAKSARLRTLLPLLRSTLLIVIAVVAGLMVLSEIGLNIAPLLAGAGILGVAIGFGSQKLVQDLITGIFLLLENAMQVGDNVTVSGLSGTVEALSVRTIRLRAGDGSVHIIPFSSVTSVTNVNRGLGNAAISVAVAYAEDTDRVCAELTDIVAGMRNDAALSAMMLSDLQLWGVDKVDGAAVTIAGQVVCTDSGRWPVQREFNRRMKHRFQELGIKVYNPVQTMAFAGPYAAPGTDDQGNTPLEKIQPADAAKENPHAHAQAAD